MSTQMVMFMAKETAITMGLAFNHKGWMMGQIKMLPEEAQEKYMKKMGKGKDDQTTMTTTWMKSSACSASTASE